MRTGEVRGLRQQLGRAEQQVTIVYTAYRYCDTTLFTVHFVLYTVYCTLFSVHYLLLTVYCTLLTVHRLAYTVTCTL